MTLACTGIGIGVSRAIALGPAYLLRRGPIDVTPRWIEEREVEAEVERFRRALETARRELQLVRAQIPPHTPPDIADFIDAHLLMLEDVTITEAPLDLIRNQLCRAEWALQVRRDAMVQVFEEMDDAYLRTRKDDVNHVVVQIQKFLVQGEGGGPGSGEEDLMGRVVIAQDLTPADTILLRHRGVAAFVTEFGGPVSHTAILARSLGIPAVVGVRNATQYLRHGEMLVVDGEQGVVLAGADAPILDYYRHRISEQLAHKEAQRRLADQPSRSADGVPVHLLANIELPEDIPHAIAAGATGVGLYRTEFLYMNRTSTPNEEEQLAAYLDVVRGLNGIPVTIRTLDLGADKQVEGRTGVHCPPACNPALGLRAIRLCLKELQLFLPQIRAILRASAEGPVRMMLPMLSTLAEIHSTRRLVEEAKQELRRQGLRFDPEIAVGGMIEVPAAALAAADLARHLDFLSIGTNDLIQYTLAIDRVDDEVNYLFDPLHPAVLRLIAMTIAAGRRCRVQVAMCGEMAGDPRYTRLLLGLGLRELSMQPNSLLDVKEIVRNSDIGRLTARVRKVFQRLRAGDGEAALDEINQDGP
jgi:phosphoenolpyruvate-protein phosphotransferase (PTS system enzyme I)